MGMLDPGERVEADDGYVGESPKYVKCPSFYAARTNQARMRGRVRMRHESVNERFKNFRCMVDRFRHGEIKHALCFRAVAVLVQLSMMNGEKLFDVREYNDRLTDKDVARIFRLYDD